MIDTWVVFGSISTTMSQDLLRIMRSKGDENGVGKNHEIRVRYNNKNKKDPSKKFEIVRYNPKARKHTVYVQKK